MYTESNKKGFNTNIMDNFTIYKEGKYDIKANLSMKLEEVGMTVSAKLIALDHYVFKELGRK